MTQANSQTAPAHFGHHQPTHNYERASLAPRHQAPQTSWPHPVLDSSSAVPHSGTPSGAEPGHLPPHAPQGLVEEQAAAEEDPLPEELLQLLPDGPPFAGQHDSEEAGGSPAPAAAGGCWTPGFLWRAAAAEPEGPPGLASASREYLADAAGSRAGGGTPDPESGGWIGSGPATGSWAPPLPVGVSDAGRPPAPRLEAAGGGGCADEGGGWAGRFETVVDEAAAAAAAFEDPFRGDWEHWAS